MPAFSPTYDLNAPSHKFNIQCEFFGKVTAERTSGFQLTSPQLSLFNEAIKKGTDHYMGLSGRYKALYETLSVQKPETALKAGVYYDDGIEDQQPDEMIRQKITVEVELDGNIPFTKTDVIGLQHTIEDALNAHLKNQLDQPLTFISGVTLHNEGPVDGPINIANRYREQASAFIESTLNDHGQAIQGEFLAQIILDGMKKLGGFSTTKENLSSALNIGHQIEINNFPEMVFDYLRDETVSQYAKTMNDQLQHSFNQQRMTKKSPEADLSPSLR